MKFLIEADMTIKDITVKYLQENGYDGIVFPGMCSCVIDDLAPCDGPWLDCEPGYKGKCTCGEGCSFDMYAVKPQKGDKEYLE